MSAQTAYYADDSVQLFHGDSLSVLRGLPDGSVDCCVTSPPYFGLRDYGVEGQQGLESSPAEYVAGMVAVFAEVRRVLADDGTLWLNIGDSYSSSGGMSGVGPNALVGSTKNRAERRTRPSARRDRAAMPLGAPSTLPAKNLMGIPWRLAFGLQDDGWILRNDIIWAKPNGMPESVTDRLSTKHEHLFMFSKSPRYWFDLDPIRDEAVSAAESRPQYARAKIIAQERGITDEHIAAMRSVGMSDAGKALTTQDGTGKNRASVQALADEAKSALGGYYREFLTTQGRNPGDVWSIPTQPFSEAHFAVMPQALAARAIQAGCKPGGTVLDPYSGSGTTGLAAAKHGRKYVGIDLSRDYLDMSLRTRLSQAGLFDVAVEGVTA